MQRKCGPAFETRAAAETLLPFPPAAHSFDVLVRRVVQISSLMHSVGTDSSGKWGVFAGESQVAPQRGTAVPGLHGALPLHVLHAAQPVRAWMLLMLWVVLAAADLKFRDGNLDLHRCGAGRAGAGVAGRHRGQVEGASPAVCLTHARHPCHCRALSGPTLYTDIDVGLGTNALWSGGPRASGANAAAGTTWWNIRRWDAAALLLPRLPGLAAGRSCSKPSHARVLTPTPAARKPSRPTPQTPPNLATAHTAQ